MKKQFKLKLNIRIISIQIIILITGILLWELGVSQSETAKFLYGSPTNIVFALYRDISSLSLLHDAVITSIETIVGFIIGNTIGICIGLGLWYSKTIFKIAKPYITVFGAIPLFTLAPLLIIWFGTGMTSKIVLVILSTVLLSMMQAYKGASEVDIKKMYMLKAFGANKNDIFKILIIPSSLSWVLSAIKLNVGFALLGAFIGEFISSKEGVGHYIIKASGLYDIPSVFSGIIVIGIIALTLNFCIETIEKKITPWI